MDSPTGVVDDVLYDTTDVTIAFCKVKVAQTGGGFVVVRVGLELDEVSVFAIGLHI